MKQFQGRNTTEIETVKELKEYLSNFKDDCRVSCGVMNEGKESGASFYDLNAVDTEGLYRDSDDDVCLFADLGSISGTGELDIQGNELSEGDIVKIIGDKDSCFDDGDICFIDWNKEDREYYVYKANTEDFDSIKDVLIIGHLPDED